MIKFKSKDDAKQTLIARDDVQAAAFAKQGLVPATKADEAKFYGEEPEKEPEKEGGQE